MAKTLTVDDTEIPTLQRLLQKGNADLPTRSPHRRRSDSALASAPRPVLR